MVSHSTSTMLRMVAPFLSCIAIGLPWRGRWRPPA
jgi:hypothetical protein